MNTEEKILWRLKVRQESRTNLGETQEENLDTNQGDATEIASEKTRNDWSDYLLELGENLVNEDALADYVNLWHISTKRRGIIGKADILLKRLFRKICLYFAGDYIAFLLTRQVQYNQRNMDTMRTLRDLNIYQQQSISSLRDECQNLYRELAIYKVLLDEGIDIKIREDLG